MAIFYHISHILHENGLFREKDGFVQQCPVRFLHRRLLVLRRPTNNKFAGALLLREDYFPLTLTLSPIGGEGKMRDRFNALWLLNAATSPTPSPPASGGEGWGEGGRTTACNFLTGQCWNLGGFEVFPGKSPRRPGQSFILSPEAGETCRWRPPV